MNKSDVVTVITLLFFIGGCVSGIYIPIDNFPMKRDTDHTLDRCQVMANVEDMADCLESVVSAMEEYEITEGSTALIFHTPATDLSLDYQAVQSLLERACAVQDMPVDSVEYQVALDDMRGTIREINIEAAFFLNKTRFLYWYGRTALFSWLIPFIILIWEDI